MKLLNFQTTQWNVVQLLTKRPPFEEEDDDEQEASNEHASHRSYDNGQYKSWREII